jgi:hypothetical protein
MPHVKPEGWRLAGDEAGAAWVLPGASPCFVVA